MDNVADARYESDPSDGDRLPVPIRLNTGGAEGAFEGTELGTEEGLIDSDGWLGGTNEGILEGIMDNDGWLDGFALGT